MMPARRLGAVSIALGLILASAGASARAAETYRADPKLVEAARKEGEVVVYTTLIVDQMVRPMIKAFEAAVPGIKVSYVRADGLALVLRMTNELRAGRVQSDVWCMVDGVRPLIQAGAFDEFEVPSAKDLPTALVDPHRRWVATNLGIRSMAYNTSLIPPAQAPHSYRDLLDPRWNGKMVWNPRSMTGAWGFIATAVRYMGEEQGIGYLRQLAKQEVVPLPIAIRAVLDRVIAGEYAIGLEMNNTHAAVSAAQGAPVAFMPLDRVSETLQAAGISKGAAHPNAARLFVDFMVSRAGQEVFRDNDYIPMHPDIAAKIPTLKPEQGGFQAIIYSPEDIDSDIEHWAKVYDDIFR
jgi:ABC-type Fe3+ transport system substrate-binding protein